MTPECERLGLVGRAVSTPDDVEQLRQLRNETAWGFSTDNDYISPERQQQWWASMHGHVRAWLYGHGLAWVGFGVLRQTEDGRWWSSVGVRPAYAGKGYGGAITADLIRRHDEPIWATARLDNPAAQRLHRATDWEEIDRDDRLVYYRTYQHVYLATATEEWATTGWVLT